MGQGDAPGGSAELCRLIDLHGGVLVPDMLRYYGIDLRDLFDEVDPLDPGWVLTNVSALPIESRFMAELRGGQHFVGWDEGRYMLARLINGIAALNYTLILIHRDPEKAKPEPPEPYRIPDDLGKRKRPPMAGSFASMMLGHMNKTKKIKEVGDG